MGAVVEEGGPFRLDTAVLDLDATLVLTDDCIAGEEFATPASEELLFLVLDVFKCIGPVLEVLSLLAAAPAAAAAEGSILSADLALATMPVLMEPDFTVLLGFAEGSATVFSGDDCSTGVIVDAFGLWIGLSASVSTCASVLATASMLTAAGMSACDELRLEFRLQERSIINFCESLLFKDEFERSSCSPPRFLASPRPVSRSKRRTILATLRG